MNIDNLLRVKSHILEEPRRFIMSNWKVDMTHAPESVRPPCGTAACIAGWADILQSEDAGTVPPKYEVHARAACFFDITDLQGDLLFDVEEWPDDLHERANAFAEGTQEFANVAAEAIDRFIACGGYWQNEIGLVYTPPVV